jgi:hypothetical protein
MTKRDNELSRPELIEKRAKKLLDLWEMHRGQLPEDLVAALEGLRKAVDGSDAHVAAGQTRLPLSPEAQRRLDPTHDVRHDVTTDAHVDEVRRDVQVRTDVPGVPVPVVTGPVPEKPGTQEFITRGTLVTPPLPPNPPTSTTGTPKAPVKSQET